MKKNEKWRKEIAKYYKKKYDDIEDTFLKNTKALAKEQEEMLKKLKNYEISQKEFSKWRIAEEKYLQEQVNDLANSLSQADMFAVDKVNSVLPEYYAEAMNKQLWQVERYGIQTNFDVVNANAVSRSVRGKYFKKIDTARNTAYNRRRIRSAITAGVLRGSSIQDIAKSLKPIVDGNAKSALLNARTWVNSVENGGHYDEAVLLNDAGVHMKKMWLSAGDDRVRDSHRELDQEERDIDEPFSNGGQYPCDPALDADEYYNCRCTILNYVMGYAPDLNKRNMDLGGKSYEEWKQGKQSGKQVIDYHSTNDFTSYKDFEGNGHEAINYHEEHNWSNEKWDDMSLGERQSLEYYTGELYDDMNTALRDGASSQGGSLKKYIQDATKALDKCKVAEDCVLYRGAFNHKSTFAKALGLDRHYFRDNHSDLKELIGLPFTEKGFMSTGIYTGAGWDKAVNFKIYVPKGTKGLYVDPISTYKGENELLLQRNTTFEIIDIENGGEINVTLKVISQKR